MTRIFSRKIAVAPMMGYTDRHFRYLMRLISPSVLLYTEMYTAADVLKNSARIQFDPAEHPVAIQLGGSDPKILAACAKIAAEMCFDEVNLNVGCPSDRVQQGKIGACLMKEPGLVADCVAAMQHMLSIPVTVKCRLGVDNQESYEELHRFIAEVAQAGCCIFIIHARKAWLRGLNPKQNRDIPPLNYDWVYRLKLDFPQLSFIVNGGIKSIDEIKNHLQHVDGVMIGRSAYQNPFLLSEVDAFLSQAVNSVTRVEVVARFLPYLQRQMLRGVKFTQLSRHLFSLFHGLPGAKEWRRMLGANSSYANQCDVIRNALVTMVSSKLALSE